MVNEGAQQDKLAYGKPRHGYSCQAAQLWIEHPPRDLERTSMRLSDQDVVNTVMLVVADDQHGLTDQRMKRIGDHGFECQKPGTMEPARMAEPATGRLR
ncbi:MAG TPA: hypothetical protein VGC15_07700 [Acetobacteraceae bacterium]